MVLTENGRYMISNEVINHEFYLTDHLGNVRVVFTKDETGQKQVLQETHYYPFGHTLLMEA